MSGNVRPLDINGEPNLNDCSLPIDGSYPSGFNSLARNSLVTKVGVIEIVEDDSILHQVNDISSTEYMTPLLFCKEKILEKFYILVVIIGWRPFGVDTYKHRTFFRCLNIIYPALCIIFLFGGYIFNMATIPMKNQTNSNNHTEKKKQCRTSEIFLKTFFAYCIPDFVNLISYLYGLWYYRLHRTESLFGLIEKVMLRSKKSQISSTAQKDLQFRLKFIMSLLIIWYCGFVIFSAIAVVLQVFGCSTICYFSYSVDKSWFLSLIAALTIFGQLIYYLVYVAVFCNYAMMCEVIIFSISYIDSDLRQKSIIFRDAFRDVWNIRQYFSALNGIPSKMTSICFFHILYVIFFYSIYALSTATNDDMNGKLKPTCSSINIINTFGILIFWVIMIIVPVLQGCRLNTIVRKLKKAVIEVRLFGYPNASREDTDSLLHFTSMCEVKAKLLWFPVLPEYCVVVFIVVLFATVIHFQA